MNDNSAARVLPVPFRERFAKPRDMFFKTLKLSKGIATPSETETPTLLFESLPLSCVFRKEMAETRLPQHVFAVGVLGAVLTIAQVSLVTVGSHSNLR